MCGGMSDESLVDVLTLDTPAIGVHGRTDDKVAGLAFFARNDLREKRSLGQGVRGRGCPSALLKLFENDLHTKRVDIGV